MGKTLITTQKNLVVKTLFGLFILNAILNLIAEYTDHSTLIYVSKPLLMILLGAYFFMSTTSRLSRFKALILCGLFFSLGGDTFLMLVKGHPAGEQFFLLGLCCFLATHLCYTAAFAGYLKEFKKAAYLFSKPWAALPLVAFWILLMLVLWPGIPAALKVPVGIYSLAIVVMCLSAINLRGSISANAFLPLVLGVLLFLFSDSLIAISKFNTSIQVPQSRLLIMVTYILGQFLIVKGAIQICQTIQSHGYEASKPK